MKAIGFWLTVGAVGYLLVPWYAGDASVQTSALFQVIDFGRVWLAPLGALLLAGAILLFPALDRTLRARGLLVMGAAGLVAFFVQGFTIGPHGWESAALARAFGALSSTQHGMGAGALLVATAFAMLFALGLAERGAFGGDGFVTGSVTGIALLTALFTFYPVLRILQSALENERGALVASAFLDRILSAKVWGVSCVWSAARCGVAWNTLALGVLCGAGCTLLGLALALISARSESRFRKVLRALSILPIITPPFVIGLGLILLFGRSGVVNQLLEAAFGIELGRWFYGLPGLLAAQLFAFTPIAFLVLIGVVEGVSPTMEEAAQMLRAGRWRSFVDVSLPLMRPGLANAFLVSFIESIADFGNPIVLGGNFGVLSTEVYFSVVGAQLDQGRAAALGIVLLGFALAAFFAQRRLLGRAAYTSLSGKGDSGMHTPLPVGVRRTCFALALPWALLTIAIYAMTFAGGFVEQWGRDYSPTLKHYAKAFAIEQGPHGLLWIGTAWSSFWTTLRLSAVAAPATAILGLLTAYILTRHRFAGRSAYEFATMLSFAIPGTVIGVSYILAFNVPPIEITGTALILILCNVFRNMPVGVRAGIASLAQVDPTLDEASATLGARGFATLRRILMPLVKPAVVAALVYSFVRAMTTVSAVVFLVSADYEWATTYIINRVTNGDYGVAIAYSTLLIVVMLIAIGLIQRLVGERRLGRRVSVASASIAGLEGTGA